MVDDVLSSIRDEIVGNKLGDSHRFVDSDTIASTTEVNDDDNVLDFGKFMIVIDPASKPYLAGSTLDYETIGINSQFKFANPNVQMACGCGVSIQFD